MPAKTKPGGTSGAPGPTNVDPEGHARQIDHTAVAAEEGVDSIGGSLGAVMRRSSTACSSWPERASSAASTPGESVLPWAVRGP